MEVEIREFEEWDDFDELVEILQKNYKSLIIQKFDGPDARVCQLVTDEMLHWLVFDDLLGSFFKTEYEADLNKLKLLAEEITRIRKTKHQTFE